MPYDDPDPDDPHVLVGVGLAASEAATREMAAAFADEFAQMGFDRAPLLRIFDNPFYAGAHAALQALGASEIGRIVDESLRAYGGRRLVTRDAVGGGDPEAGEGTRRGKRVLRVLQEG